MVFLALMLVSGALFIGFLALTSHESRSDSRYFSHWRDDFDMRVSRITFVLTHVDFEAFLREQARRIAAQVTHDVAHLVLLLVREAERFLTRVVKYLRSRHEIPVSKNEAPRPFVKAMSDFKTQLRAAHAATPQNIEQTVG